MLFKKLIYLSLLFLLIGCGSTSSSEPDSNISNQPPAQGTRILGLDIKDTPLTPYVTAYSQAMTMGVREVSVSLDWNIFEPTTVGTYVDTFSILSAADNYYPTQSGDITLVLRPLDTAGPSVPADLAGLPYDDPAVITAFENFLDHLHSQLPTLNASGKLKWIHVGNEIDGPLGSNSTQWAQWTTFFNAAKTRIKNLWGASINVSSVVQFSGLSNASVRTEYLNFLPYLDSAALTYYPLNADFTVKPVTIVATDFAFITSTITNKTILLQECGYPSSAANNSSETLQADFITAVFNAWDTHSDRIDLVDFAWQYDVSPTTVDEWVAAYGMTGQPNEEEFKGYLGSIGLSNNDSTEKLALQRLIDELLTRSWIQ
jgi:hypothetical protein